MNNKFMSIILCGLLIIGLLPLNAEAIPFRKIVDALSEIMDKSKRANESPALPEQDLSLLKDASKVAIRKGVKEWSKCVFPDKQQSSILFLHEAECPLSYDSYVNKYYDIPPVDFSVSSKANHSQRCMIAKCAMQKAPFFGYCDSWYQKIKLDCYME